MTNIAYPLPARYIARRPAFSLFVPLDVLDETGRPLMENRTVRHEPPENSLAPCPYTDHRARQAKPINLGALKDFNRYGNATLELLSKYCHCVKLGDSTQAGATTLQIWRVAKLGVSVPSRILVPFLLRESGDRELDGPIGAIYKVSRGLMDLMLNASNFLPSIEKVWSADEILEFIERHEQLVGRREVCAAPLVLIRRVLAHIVERLSKDIASETQIPADKLDFTVMLSLMERLSFVFELTRCSMHLRLTDSSAPGPTTRHTFAAARDALSLASQSSESQLQALQKLARFHWRSFDPVAEKLFDDLLGQSIDLLAHANCGSTRTAWEDFFALSLEGVQLINEKLVAAGHMHDMDPCVITPRDLEIFFGPSPTFQ